MEECGQAYGGGEKGTQNHSTVTVILRKNVILILIVMEKSAEQEQRYAYKLLWLVKKSPTIT